ncbi:MAG TPA: hypothetical protein PLO67_07725 [Saprospiraceae bacterium]|nr:hypothetical protein [Saprospiraceae bacterium]HPI05762.1 hypothetical protein [Saprospiraceae bacterium]
MNAKLKVDRQFLFLHGDNLAVFSERVLRNTQAQTHASKATFILERLNAANIALRSVLADSNLKRKLRTEAVREKEAIVLHFLGEVADFLENNLQFKSDIFTSGFRPYTTHRKTSATRLEQRMAAKLARLEVPKPEETIEL